MSWEWTTATALNFTGACIVAAFGLAVLALRTGSPQAALVGWFSVAFGAATVGINLLLVVGPEAPLAPWFGWFAAAASAVANIPLFLMWFWLPSRWRPNARQLMVPLGLLISGIVFITLPRAIGSLDSETVAFLGPPSSFYFAVAGVQLGNWWGLLWLLALRFGRSSPEDTDRAQIALLAGALLLYPATNSGFVFGTDEMLVRFSWATILAALLVAAGWLWAGHRAQRPKAARNIAWLILFVVLIAAIEGIGKGSLSSGIGINGIARILTVAILSYAVVRHHVLGIDVRVRWGISKGAVAGVILAAIFIASEGAQAWFGEEDQWIGLLVGGSVIFAISPLQRMADRVAEKAVPSTSTTSTPPDESSGCEDRYRAVVARFLRDGIITPDEERTLAHLADDLRISSGRAFELRLEVQAETGMALRDGH